MAQALTAGPAPPPPVLAHRADLARPLALLAVGLTMIPFGMLPLDLGPIGVGILTLGIAAPWTLLAAARLAHGTTSE